MRFVNKWAYACARGLAGTMNENHQKRAVYYFGFQILLGALVKGVILVTISFLLGILFPVLIIVFTFGSLRLVAGGYHMDTYGKCLFTSMILFLAAGLAVQHTFKYWNFAALAFIISVTFILGLYVIVKYAPRDTPNKRITKPEDIRKFKRLSLVYLGVWLAATAALSALGLKMAVLSLCFGVLLEIFTITPVGHSFFDLIRDGFGKRKIVHL